MAAERNEFGFVQMPNGTFVLPEEHYVTVSSDGIRRDIPSRREKPLQSQEAKPQSDPREPPLIPV